ncbi:MAG: hypothetical protein V1850_04365 [Candidatus Bathyarchaeota archaeon]
MMTTAKKISKCSKCTLKPVLGWALLLTTTNYIVDAMKKVDFKKELNDLYSPSSLKVAIVNVPAMNFLMVDGKGNPSTAQEYKNAIEALYAVSYVLKFMVKKGKEIDYVVMPLVGR